MEYRLVKSNISLKTEANIKHWERAQAGVWGRSPQQVLVMPTCMEPADVHAGSAGEERSDDPRCKHGHQLEPCRRHELKLVNYLIPQKPKKGKILHKQCTKKVELVRVSSLCQHLVSCLPLPVLPHAYQASAHSKNSKIAAT